MALFYAVDINVLLSLSHRQHPQHDEVETAIFRLGELDVELCFTAQNLGEFWNVSTRPFERNGFGLSIQKTETLVASIERTMRLLPKDPGVYQTWRRLLFSREVRGVQVHDAHIAAVLEVHGVEHLLTYKGRDFRRFAPTLTVVHPLDVQ